MDKSFKKIQAGVRPWILGKIGTALPPLHGGKKGQQIRAGKTRKRVLQEGFLLQCSGSAGSLPRSIWKTFPPGGETVPLICVFSRKPEQVFFPHRCLCPSTSSVHHG